MRFKRTLRVEFALLLALMLPLQSYAAASACAQLEQASAGADLGDSTIHHANLGVPSAESPPASPHCAHETGAMHRHGCGSCCCGTAIALIPVRWLPPRSAAPDLPQPLAGISPTVALDRLDRPPRILST